MRALMGVILTGLLAVTAYGQSLNNPQALSTANVATESNPWAQLIADAMRTQARADAAFLAAGFFDDARLAAGAVSPADVVKALQFKDDEVVVLTLKGSQIRAAMERAVSLSPQRNSAFLQVSGLRVEFDPSAASGSRITTITVGDRALEDGRDYKVATTAPLGRGALGYFKVWDKGQITSSTGQTAEDAINAFLNGKSSLPLDTRPRVSGR